MSADAQENFRNSLTVVRGGLYATPRTVREKLDAAVQARYVALRAAKVAGDPVDDAARGKTHPLAVLWRHIERAKAQRASYEQTKAFAVGCMADVERAVDRLYGRHLTGEHVPPAA